MLGGPLEWSALFESLTIHIFLRVCVCLAFLALEEKGARERKKYIILKKKIFFLKSGKSFYSQVLKMLLFLIFFVFKFHFYQPPAHTAIFVSFPETNPTGAVECNWPRCICG